MPKVVVITGGSAGVGRATAMEFARQGWNVAIIARDQQRLQSTARDLQSCGVQTLAVSADVSDFDALDRAAGQVEDELGPIDVWVNNAMATIFAPVRFTTPAEFRRATEVTYLGQVHGTMAALARMRPRNRGTIVNIGSALAYRAIPLQAAYCGAKFAVRGFTDALRCELLHEGVDVHLTMVHLPAVNTPQFDWALNKMGRRAQPVPPIYQPEVPARAIVFAVSARRREVWVGMPTLKAIVANKLAPGLLDRILAKSGYSGQLTQDVKPAGSPANLYTAVPGSYGSHGRFDSRSRRESLEFALSKNRGLVLSGVLALGVVVAAATSSLRRAAIPVRKGRGR